MASMALTSRRVLFAGLRRPGFLSTFSWSTPAISVAIPSLQSILDLFPSIVLAVPKKKVSHSRKRMRSANKGLEDKTNIVNCPGCGGPKLAHHLCPACYSSMSREWKANSRGPIDMVEDSEPPLRPT